MRTFVSQYKCVFILAGLFALIYGGSELYDWYDLRVFKELAKDERNYVIEEIVDEDGDTMYRLLWPNGKIIEYSRNKQYLEAWRKVLAKSARTNDEKWDESLPDIPIPPKERT